MSSFFHIFNPIKLSNEEYSFIHTLEAMNTNWLTLEAKLQSLIQNIKDASDISMNFISADMQIVKENWDNIYNNTHQLYWEVD